MHPDILDGYRLVRRLGEGPRAEVFLATPAHPSDAAEAETVALKVARPGVPVESTMLEIEALSRCSSAHVVELLDVLSGPDGAPVPLLRRLSTRSLARVCAERQSLRSGEAVTLLVPIAEAVAGLHRAGVVHGAVRGGAVLFDRAGAPVLAAFGSAGVIESELPPARLDAEVGVLADLEALAALAGTVLTRVDSAAPLLEWLGAEPPLTHEWSARLVDRLFDLADPEPVELRQPAARAVPVVPHRALPVVEAPVPPVPEWVTRQLPDAVVRLVPEAARFAARLRDGVRTVRPAVWIAVVVAAAALATAFALVPTGDDPQPREPAAPSSSVPSAAPPENGAITADDPVAAAPLLLAARERCIRDLSLRCLDDVDQAGSSALADDQAVIRAIEQGTGTFTPVEDDAASLVDRLGDTAIVALGPNSEPASVLLVKGEAGWRIRSFLEG